MSVMPLQKPGRSKQDYGTPRVFLDAVEQRFGELNIDLAAHEGNRVTSSYFGPGGIYPDSLSDECDWSNHGGVLWLNPEFGNIAPWAEKCAANRNRSDWILFLVPASIGTDWFKEHVQHKSIVLGLSPRMSFDGKNAYPKDLMLCCYGFGLSGFDTWRWKPGWEPL